MKSEQFHKLSQMDRIEYILVKENQNKDRSLVTFEYVGIVFKMWFVIFATGMLFYIGFDNLAILKILPIFKPLFLWGTGLSIVLDIYSYIQHKKKSEKIDAIFLKRRRK